ncbi:hypothetical protein [Flavobacterium piscis]|uniref:Ribonuclease E n=1 Tax=Flavobacterium piscis TaxID=1114874 RepID=A0ABU1YBW0_9FLAO|nr:hypothetical protein [Flavobacterium piscis]MDR7211722.1 ribonuclease E [Flavobacterium piscis]
MITDNNRNYNQDETIFNPNNQNYTDHYQYKQIAEETGAQQKQFLNEEEIFAAIKEQNYMNDEFSIALDDFENDFEENEPEEENPKEDEKENYDEEEIEEPETFADDGYKID